MIKAKTIKYFLHNVCIRNKNVLWKYLGNAKPFIEHINDPMWPLCHQAHFMNTFFSLLLSCTINHKSKTISNALAHSKTFMHFCKLLAHLTHETWIPENRQAEGLQLCALIIIDGISYTISTLLKISKRKVQKHINQGDLLQIKIKKNSPEKEMSSLLNEYLKKAHLKKLKKIHKMLCSSNPRHNCLLMRSRYTVQHKPLTQLKRKIGSLENKIVTNRIARGLDPKSICDVIRPSINIVRQSAITSLILGKATLISTTDLFSLLNSLNEIPEDTDCIYLVSNLVDMARNRLRVKLLQVNENVCTCHTKCTGYDFNSFWQREISYKGLKRDTTIFCCERCRLTSTVRNTRARQPRITVSAANPALSVCSLDGCREFHNTNLYTCDYFGYGVFKYQHLFYSTNTTNEMEQLCGKTPTGPSSNIYGMCFGGRRLCMKKFWTNCPSSLHIDSQIAIGNRDKFLCSDCTKTKRMMNNIPSKLYSKWNIVDENTCVEYSQRELQRTKNLSGVIKKICLGCKLKFLCSHITKLHCNKPLEEYSFSEKLVIIKKAITINKIRQHLTRNE